MATATATPSVEVQRSQCNQQLILCLGDSLTPGDTGLGFMAQRPWPLQIGEILGCRVLDCGHNGAGTFDYRFQAEWELAREHAAETDMLIAGLGTNDIDLNKARRLDELETVATRLASIIDDFFKLSDGGEPVAILSVPEFASQPPIIKRFDPKTINEMNTAVHALNTQYRRLCDRRRWMYLDYASAINQRRELFGN